MTPRDDARRKALKVYMKSYRQHPKVKAYHKVYAAEYYRQHRTDILTKQKTAYQRRQEERLMSLLEKRERIRRKYQV
jgi:hypothetical protein